MKKNLLFLAILYFLSSFSFAQIGIGTVSPNLNSILDISSTNEALLLPRVANTSAIVSPENGMIIYDISSNCFKGYQNNGWSGCIDITAMVGSIATLYCYKSINNGTLTEGTLALGVSSVIPYTGINTGTHIGQTVMSTGVTGLTATLLPGNFVSGQGFLTYNISGTPSASGVASFAISVDGKTCTLTRTVDAAISIPSTITLAENRKYFIPSIYDQDYLPFIMPTVPANTSLQAANGLNELLLDFQGKITTSGVSIRIPVVATGSNTIPAFSTTINVPASLTEDGISRNISLLWAAQTYTAATTFINATIVSIGGTLNAKKLDINAGIGNDVLGVLMGTFTYPYNNAGNTTTFQIRDIAGIPDKMYGNSDLNNDYTSHFMLYLPILAEDGKIWLSNNLGAHYSNINNLNFSFIQQANSSTDFKAYGSFFQWGRKPDGHELINFTNATTGAPENGNTTVLADVPLSALFIYNNTAPKDWRVSQNTSLWTLESAFNNPCPTGFRLPTVTEQSALISAAGITNIATAANSVLKLTSSGMRNNVNGDLINTGTNGRYWSSSTVATGSNSLNILSSTVGQNAFPRAYGFNVRCIQN